MPVITPVLASNGEQEEKKGGGTDENKFDAAPGSIASSDSGSSRSLLRSSSTTLREPVSLSLNRTKSAVSGGSSQEATPPNGSQQYVQKP